MNKSFLNCSQSICELPTGKLVRISYTQLVTDDPRLNLLSGWADYHHQQLTKELLSAAIGVNGGTLNAMAAKYSRAELVPTKGYYLANLEILKESKLAVALYDYITRCISANYGVYKARRSTLRSKAGKDYNRLLSRLASAGFIEAIPDKDTITFKRPAATKEETAISCQELLGKKTYYTETMEAQEMKPAAAPSRYSVYDEAASEAHARASRRKYEAQDKALEVVHPITQGQPEIAANDDNILNVLSLLATGNQDAASAALKQDAAQPTAQGQPEIALEVVQPAIVKQEQPAADYLIKPIKSNKSDFKAPKFNLEKMAAQAEIKAASAAIDTPETAEKRQPMDNLAADAQPSTDTNTPEFDKDFGFGNWWEFTGPINRPYFGKSYKGIPGIDKADFTRIGNQFWLELTRTKADNYQNEEARLWDIYKNIPMPAAARYSLFSLHAENLHQFKRN